MIRCLNILVSLVLISCVGCVERKLTVTSDPPGALVVLNHREAGRTPFTTDFTWYGTYDVEVRLEGYTTQTTTRTLVAPWWQWPPFDLLAEMMIWRPTDRREMSFTMVPRDEKSQEPSELVKRGAKMRDELE